MFTKIIEATNLFPYFISKYDSTGQLREQPPFLLRGNPGRAIQFLRRKAPKSRRKHDRDPRFIDHCKRHLLHTISCFSEDEEKVRNELPLVIDGTENLFLAGLPRHALDFVWYEHGKKRGTHAHGALTLSLLPEGGPFSERTRAGLRQCFDQLASHARGLSHPMDPRRARLVKATRFSSKLPCNRPDIQTICQATAQWWKKSPDRTHRQFVEELLEQELKFDVLCSPGPTGAACVKENAKNYPKKFKPYHRKVIVAGRSGEMIVLEGEICQHNFSADAWNAVVDERKTAFLFLRDHTDKVYERFKSLLALHIQDQQAAYRLPGEKGERVGIADFEWLKPSSSSPGCPDLSEDMAEDPQIWELDVCYPFHSEYDDTVPQEQEEDLVALTGSDSGLIELELIESSPDLDQTDEEQAELDQPEIDRPDLAEPPGIVLESDEESQGEDQVLEANLTYLTRTEPPDEQIIWPGRQRLAAHVEKLANRRKRDPQAEVSPARPRLSRFDQLLARAWGNAKRLTARNTLRQLAVAVNQQIDVASSVIPLSKPNFAEPLGHNEQHYGHVGAGRKDKGSTSVALRRATKAGEEKEMLQKLRRIEESATRISRTIDAAIESLCVERPSSAPIVRVVDGAAGTAATSSFRRPEEESGEEPSSSEKKQRSLDQVSEPPAGTLHPALQAVNSPAQRPAKAESSDLQLSEDHILSCLRPVLQHINELQEKGAFDVGQANSCPVLDPDDPRGGLWTLQISAIAFSEQVSRLLSPDRPPSPRDLNYPLWILAKRTLAAIECLNKERQRSDAQEELTAPLPGPKPRNLIESQREDDALIDMLRHEMPDAVKMLECLFDAVGRAFEANSPQESGEPRGRDGDPLEYQQTGAARADRVCASSPERRFAHFISAFEHDLLRQTRDVLKSLPWRIGRAAELGAYLIEVSRGRKPGPNAANSDKAKSPAAEASLYSPGTPQATKTAPSSPGSGAMLREAAIPNDIVYKLRSGLEQLSALAEQAQQMLGVISEALAAAGQARAASTTINQIWTGPEAQEEPYAPGPQRSAGTGREGRPKKDPVRESRADLRGQGFFPWLKSLPAKASRSIRELFGKNPKRVSQPPTSENSPVENAIKAPNQARLVETLPGKAQDILVLRLTLEELKNILEGVESTTRFGLETLAQVAPSAQRGLHNQAPVEQPARNDPFPLESPFRDEPMVIAVRSVLLLSRSIAERVAEATRPASSSILRKSGGPAVTSIVEPPGPGPGRPTGTVITHQGPAHAGGRLDKAKAEWASKVLQAVQKMVVRIADGIGQTIDQTSHPSQLEEVRLPEAIAHDKQIGDRETALVDIFDSVRNFAQTMVDSFPQLATQTGDSALFVRNGLHDDFEAPCLKNSVELATLLEALDEFDSQQREGERIPTRELCDYIAWVLDLADAIVWHGAEWFNFTRALQTKRKKQLALQQFRSDRTIAIGVETVARWAEARSLERDNELRASRLRQLRAERTLSIGAVTIAGWASAQSFERKKIKARRLKALRSKRTLAISRELVSDWTHAQFLESQSRVQIKPIEGSAVESNQVKDSGSATPKQQNQNVTTHSPDSSPKMQEPGQTGSSLHRSEHARNDEAQQSQTAKPQSIATQSRTPRPPKMEEQKKNKKGSDDQGDAGSDEPTPPPTNEIEIS